MKQEGKQEISALGPLRLLRSEDPLSAPIASPLLLTEADRRRRPRNLASGRRRRSRGSPTARELASDRCSRSHASVSPISFRTRFSHVSFAVAFNFLSLRL